MKYPKVNEPVYIQSTDLINSRHGYEVVEIVMQGIKTKTVYKTWVDPKYNNWKNWLHILEVANTKGVVISNIKLKDVDKKIVNADSEPRLEYVVTPEALANILEEYWDKQNTYKRMFGE